VQVSNNDPLDIDYSVSVVKLNGKRLNFVEVAQKFPYRRSHRFSVFTTLVCCDGENVFGALQGALDVERDLLVIL
jgi:hypothetical protein